MKYYKSLHRDASLPDPGSSPMGPRLITREAHNAIVASTDLHALAMLRGYLRSYMGTMGLVIMSAVGALIALAYADRLWTTIALVVFAGSLSVVVQTRRRAAQWLSIVDARMAELVAGGDMQNSMRVGRDFAPTGLSVSLFGREGRPTAKS